MEGRDVLVFVDGVPVVRFADWEGKKKEGSAQLREFGSCSCALNQNHEWQKESSKDYSPLLEDDLLPVDAQ